MPNVGEYFTTKGAGSQEVYDAYYTATGSTQPVYCLPGGSNYVCHHVDKQ